MYFKCNDWLYGTYLCKVSFIKGVIMLIVKPFLDKSSFNYNYVSKKDIIFD